MVTAIQLHSATAITENMHMIGCTGGGAVKYAKTFQDELGITFSPQDELENLVTAMRFARTNVPGECYTYRNKTVVADKNKATPRAGMNNESFTSTPRKDSRSGYNCHTKGGESAQRTRWSGEAKEHTFKVVVPLDFSLLKLLAESANVGATTESSRPLSTRADRIGMSRSTSLWLNNLPRAGISSQMTPHLVVNVGTHFERVSGSSLGGGTYWGLYSLLTHCSRDEEVLDMAEAGDASEVNMLVRDINGGDFE